MAIVHVLYLPLPEDLPTDREPFSELTTARFGRPWPGALDLPPDFRILDRDTLLKTAIPPPHVTVLPAPDSLDDEALEQDHFFFVVRVAGAPARTFLQGLLLSCHDALAQAGQMPTRLPAAQWEDLLETARAVFTLAGVHAAVEPDRWPLPATPSVLTGAGAREPHLRWLVGHHLFFALIQAIIVSLNLLRSDMAAGRRPTHPLAVSTRLLRAAATAMRFTSDFAPRDYTDQVRPSMMPPHVGPGFSGLQGIDHRFLITRMRGLQAEFGDLDRLPEMAAFRAEMREMLTAHTHVCERFGGGERPSLRMDALARREVNRPAIQVTSELAKRRYQLVDPANVGG